MSFNNIQGQDQAIERLRNYLEQDRLGGAYLFIGPEGVGKGLVALTLAKAVNCLEKTSDSCDSCISCRKIDGNTHPDVHVIDVKKQYEQPEKQKGENVSLEIKIEDIRQLQGAINLRAYEGKKKVFIITDAHNLTLEAANAFLKTLEEPPRESLIILTTDKPNLLLKTVISRCQAVRFFALRRDALKSVLKAEYQFSDLAAHYASFCFEGSIGRAVALKDADILGEKNRMLNEFLFPAGRMMEPVSSSRELMRRKLNTLAAWFRDCYLLKAGAPYDQMINLDRKEELVTYAGRYSPAEIEGILKVISDSLAYIEQNINIKLLVTQVRSSLKHL